ncbi:MAG: hypothetical protein CMO40_04230 [Verrucomicrobiaceae bacterium]|nr:hypothetical protein [Verrucomicrobiaceae bacterium]
MRKISSALFLVALSYPAGAVELSHAQKMAASRELFTGKVRAVLKEHCVGCHGGDKTKSGLDLVTREALLEGGDQGDAIIPGQPMESLLYLAVSHLEEDLAMPPKKPRLPAEAVAAVKQWINLGAAYDRPLLEQSGPKNAPLQVTPGDRAYWAYAPLSRESPPPAEREGQSAIDRFLAAGHREQGLVTAPPLGRRQLIRRIYFDLIGLPPTPAEIESFVRNDDPQAYQRIIDELLARPGYGERWGRHWLDLSRFAESHGFEHDYDRKFAFHFRDFVIRALNADMPYDQFVKWQIAGDELAPDDPEAMAATGFLGAGVYPTQITLSEAERIRFDATDDMLSTMGSAMLATTIGCARCHDHKYDPIPTRDYYELLSAFTQTVRSEIEIETKTPSAAALKQYEQDLGKLESEAETYRTKHAPGKLQSWLAANRKRERTKPSSPWTVLVAEPLISKGGTTFERQPDGSYLAGGPNPSSDIYTFVTTSPLANLRALRVEALAHESMKRGGPGRAGNGNIGLSHVEVTAGTMPLKLANPRATFNQSDHLHVRQVIDGNSRTGWAVDPQVGKDHAAVFEITNPHPVPGFNKRLTVKLHFNVNRQHNIGRLRLSVSSTPAAQLPLTEGQVNPAEVARRKLLTLDRELEGQARGADLERMTELYLQLDPEWIALRSRINALTSSRPQGRKEKVMVCSEGFKPMRHHTNSGKVADFYKESYYLIRGDPAQKDGEAPQDFLKVLMRNASTARNWIVPRPDDSRTSRKRSGVAAWITDVDNGAGHLLARVIVNRLWQHHFGRGIVESVNDFGFQGQKPTHPELLDYLARDLIKNGWRLKRMHRKIMLSDAYRMSARDANGNVSRDPTNRYWWKRDPRRLEAEIIRDNALAVSGLLDRQMFGPGTLDQGMKRRSIYFFVKRSRLVPMMQLFDWPDTMTSQGRRAITTTSSQALVFMNSPQVREMARHFAKSVLTESDPVGSAVYRAHGAPPTDGQRRLILTFLNEQVASYGGSKEPAMVDFCHALLAANEMIYVE